MLFLILIDGLNYRIFKRLFDEGHLPHLKQYLLAELDGVIGETITTFPSSTAPSIPELLTGKYCYWHKRLPRRIHGFDRSKIKTYRYEFLNEAWVNEPGDLFEIVNKNRGQVLSSFKGSFSKTTTSFYSEFFYSLDAITDFRSLDIFNYDEIVIMEILRQLMRNHESYGMVFLYLTTTDLNGHFHGIDDPRYAASIVALDRLLGTMFAKLKGIVGSDGGNLFDQSHFVICSDHGMVSSRNYIDIAHLFQNLQIPSLDLTRVLALIRNKLWSSWARGLDLLVLPGGSSIAELYVRNYQNNRFDTWKTRPDFALLQNYPTRLLPEFRYNLLAQLSSLRSLDLVLMEEFPDVFRLVSPCYGSARIYRKGPMTDYKFLYQAFSEDLSTFGDDPLNYYSDAHTRPAVFRKASVTPNNFFSPRFDDYFLNIDEWLHLTSMSQRPLAVPFIAKAFSNTPTRSDIILTSCPGFNFMKLSKGDHGDLSREAVVTPLMIAGPNINPEARLEHVRLIDLFPTILQLLQIPLQDIPQQIDGKPIPGLLKVGGNQTRTR